MEQITTVDDTFEHRCISDGYFSSSPIDIDTERLEEYVGETLKMVEGARNNNVLVRNSDADDALETIAGTTHTHAGAPDEA